MSKRRLNSATIDLTNTRRQDLITKPRVYSANKKINTGSDNSNDENSKEVLFQNSKLCKNSLSNKNSDSNHLADDLSVSNKEKNAKLAFDIREEKRREKLRQASHAYKLRQYCNDPTR